MNLHIFRHAWAGEAGDPNYPDDSLRPLTEEGKLRFRIFVNHLVKTRALDAQVILSSPYLRCMQTSQILSELLPSKPEIKKTAELAIEARLQPLIEVTNGLGLSEVIWCGHNPDVSYMTGTLTGDPISMIHFSKGTCASYQFTEQVVAGFGELRWSESPKDQRF